MTHQAIQDGRSTDATTQKKRRFKWLKRLLILSVVVSIALVGVLTVLAALFVQGDFTYYTAKYAPGGDVVMPGQLPSAIRPEEQTEPHTCGFHALSSLYHAYGLDPQAMNLRFRLGVDKRATHVATDSFGTIHPDVLRVLTQDGFEGECLDPRASATRDELRNHLESGHFAIALTKVSTYHWLVLCGLDGERVAICDSLQPDLYHRPLDAYLSESVYTVILIKSRDHRVRLSTIEAHLEGLEEMWKVQKRNEP